MEVLGRTDDCTFSQLALAQHRAVLKVVLLGLIKTTWVVLIASRHLPDCLLSGLDRPYQDHQDHLCTGLLSRIYAKEVCWRNCDIALGL
jgi:hypothetical protein